MTIDYGFTSTDEVQYDKAGLPVGRHKVMITGEEVGETKKETNPKPLIVEFEVIEGEFKGRSGKVWYNIHNVDAQTANIAKQQIKRIADATGKAVSPSQPLKGRVLTIEVRQQKKDPNFTEIFKYLPADATDDEIPF